MRYTVSWQPKTQHSRPPLDRPLPTAYSIHKRPNKKSSCSTMDHRHSVIGWYTVKGTWKKSSEGGVHTQIHQDPSEGMETRGGGREGGGRGKSFKKRKREEKNLGRNEINRQYNRYKVHCGQRCVACPRGGWVGGWGVRKQQGG